MNLTSGFFFLHLGLRPRLFLERSCSERSCFSEAFPHGVDILFVCNISFFKRCFSTNFLRKRVGFCAFLFRRTYCVSQAEPFATPTEAQLCLGIGLRHAEQFPKSVYFTKRSYYQLLLRNLQASLSKAHFGSLALCVVDVGCRVRACGKTEEQDDSEKLRSTFNVG